MEFLPDGGHAGACESGETMQRRARRNHTPAFKAKMAFAAIKGDRTLAQLAEAVRREIDFLKKWISERVDDIVAGRIRASARCAGAARLGRDILDPHRGLDVSAARGHLHDRNSLGVRRHRVLQLLVQIAPRSRAFAAALGEHRAASELSRTLRLAI